MVNKNNDNIFSKIGDFIASGHSENYILEHLKTMPLNPDNHEKYVFQTLDNVFQIKEEDVLNKFKNNFEIDRQKRRIIMICFVNLFTNKTTTNKSFCEKYNIELRTFQNYKQIITQNKIKEYDKDLCSYIKKTENKYNELLNRK